MSTLSDIRHAFRLLGRAPAVSVIATLSIAIGAGAAAVVFAAVKTVLIEPFPYSHPEALVQIRTDAGRGGSPRQDWVSWDDMQDVARQNHSFAALGTAVGLLMALAVARVLHHWLAGFEADDPALAGMAVALVAATAAVACWIPAWRATRIDPIAALRQE